MSRIPVTLCYATTGKGQGVGGPRQRTFGTDACVCPSCGKTVKHQRGLACTALACPKCGTKMVGADRTTGTSGLGLGIGPGKGAIPQFVGSRKFAPALGRGRNR